MAQYKVTLTITEGNKRSQRRGEREAIRYRVLKMIIGESLATLRSLRIRKVA